MDAVAPGVWQLRGTPAHAVNVYLVEDVLLDAGTRWAAGARAAPVTRPAAEPGGVDALPPRPPGGGPGGVPAVRRAAGVSRRGRRRGRGARADAAADAGDPPGRALPGGAAVPGGAGAARR